MKATKHAGVRGTLGLILGVAIAAVLTPAIGLAQGIPATA